MQRVAGREPAARVQVEPALPARLFRPRIPRGCRRPPGSSIRYCWSGSTPNVYLTSNSPIFPSGPSVRTKYRPSRVENTEVTPALVKRALEKLPRTLLLSAISMAAACCELLHCACSWAWQAAQVAEPVKSGFDARAAAVGDEDHFLSRAR
jgi:hypothetical protein